MTKNKIAHVEELEARVVREIRRGRAISRLALANLLRLAPSTVGIYVDRLVMNGYLSEDTETGRERRGRPAQQLSLRARAGCFVGAEFEAENIYAVCVDFSGAIIARHSVALPPKSGAEDVLAGLRTTIARVMKKSRLRPLGIGIGVPGIVDASRGVALNYRFIKGWTDIPITQRLHEHFDVPILLENNARAAAMGNLLFDAAGKAGDFVCLLVRSGVGAGIVSNGALHRGHHFLAGEVGRIQLARIREPVTEMTTVEDTASVHAITEFARGELKRGVASSLKDRPRRLNIQQVIDAANEGDALARQAIQRAVLSLGWLAHVLTLVVNPKTIILTGPLNALGDWLRLEVQAALNRHAAVARTAHPTVVLSQISEDAGALGAASLAIEAWKPVHGA